ncbi:MAG: hypothetical protein CFE21_11670 [Bacteroidetes bacterium B1(2017)]|nr:MAG: hypothetical protein CFE21_11670 [Bacteroidetes bacterium B1(2017)]
MKATSSNHLKQMTKAEGLITKFESFGSNFNPPNANISLQALKDNIALNKQLLFDTKASINLLVNYQNSKNKILEEVNAKVRQIELIVKALEVEESTLESVKTISANFKPRKRKPVNQIASATEGEQGTVSPALPDAVPNEKLIGSRATHKFAERRLDWLEQLVDYLTLIPSYVPNEPDLTIEGLKTYIEESKQELASWHRESEKLDALRIKRDEQLLNEKTGLVTLFRKAVFYAKSLYPRHTKEYKEIERFLFKRR